MDRAWIARGRYVYGSIACSGGRVWGFIGPVLFSWRNLGNECQKNLVAIRPRAGFCRGCVWGAARTACLPPVPLRGGVRNHAAAVRLEEAGRVDLRPVDVSSGAAGRLSRQVRWRLAGGALSLDSGLSGRGPQVRGG